MKNKKIGHGRIYGGALGSVLCALPLLFGTGSGFAQVDEYLSIVASNATGQNASASGAAIIQTCLTGANGNSRDARNNRFQDDCNTLVGGSVADPQGVTGALNSLAADQVSAQNAVAVRRNDVNLSVVAQRLQSLRVASGYSAFDSAGLIADNFMFEPMTGGGASADGESSRFGIFLNGQYLSGDEDDDDLQDGFDFDGWGAILGIDYRFSDNFVGGLTVSYSEGDADYDDDQGDLDSESQGVMAYGTYFSESGLYIEATVGYNDLEYDMSRNISYLIDGAVALQEMTSSPEGDSLSFSFGGGYTFNNDSWSYTPSLRVDYLENDIDSYEEVSSDLSTTGGAMALALDSVSFESLTSNLGIAVANAISTSSGVVIPQISLEWVHEFEDDSTDIDARYLNDINNTVFNVGTSELDSDYFDLSIGVSGQFKSGLSGFISYRTLLGYDGLSYNAIEAGFRMEL